MDDSFVFVPSNFGFLWPHNDTLCRILRGLFSSRHDPLTIMDSTGRVVSVRSGREWSDWSSELRMSGDELRWKFVSDNSVNGWGWRFTVYPIPPAAAPCDVLSDRALQSRPSIDLVRCLLGKCFRKCAKCRGTS